MMRQMVHVRCLAAKVLQCGLLLCASSAMADDAKPEEAVSEPVQYKLTISQYSARDLNATDLNLRAKLDNQAVWLAYYNENPSHFSQLRSGYERVDTWALLKLDTSVQVAEHGFLGGAISSELGGALHAIVGYGRTNLKPYDNINFDPNDAYTYGLGWRQDDAKDISLYRVRDNRVVPGQQIDHVLIHYAIADNKLTFDVFHKSGTRDANGDSISATGAALSDEWSRYFVRLAYDPKVNFSQSYMTRLSLSVYF